MILFECLVIAVQVDYYQLRGKVMSRREFLIIVDKKNREDSLPLSALGSRLAPSEFSNRQTWWKQSRGGESPGWRELL